MEEIIAWELARWIPDIIAFIVTNLLTLILIGVVLIAALIVAVLAVKRNMTKRLIQEADQAVQDTVNRIHAILTSERFRDVELGLSTGATGNRLKQLQQEGFALKRDAELLKQKVDAHQAPLFSLLGPYDEANRLREEGSRLANHTDRYERELRDIERTGDETRSAFKRIRHSFEEAVRRVDDMREQTGYALDELRSRAEAAERQLKQAEQSTAFDALQARRDTDAADRLIRALQAEVNETEKRIRTFREMKERIMQREDELRKRLSDTVEGKNGGAQSFEEIMREVHGIFASLEDALARGEQVDLRAAARRIEERWNEAARLQ